MSIHIEVLGEPGADNATLVQIESGSSVKRLLFDCGARCLDSLGVSAIQSIDHLFFSHFHMDHVCGFDSFFRLNYNRSEKPVYIWGPPGTIDVIHHRLLGVTWNLHFDQPGEWVLNEISESTVRTVRFYTRDAFEEAAFEEVKSISGALLEDPDFSISAKLLDHGSIPSVAYRIDEPVRENIDPVKLSDLGLAPGPWIRELKESTDESGTILIDGKPWGITELRSQLLTPNDGGSAAYLTDFILTPGSPEWKLIAAWLEGVDVLICEAQFCDADLELAVKHSHMTAGRVARLAKDSGVGELLLQHVSRRYDAEGWAGMLGEGKAVFEKTSFPPHWEID